MQSSAFSEGCVNVLVTGGAGYIGSLTCKELHKKGHKVFVFDNLSSSQASFVKWGTLIQGNINDKDLLYSTLKEYKIEAVFHFAGLIEVGESMREPMKYMLNNVVGTFSLLESMEKAGVHHIVFSSSCATYGNSEKLPISEETLQQPISVYGETKMFAERMIHDVTNTSSLHAVVLRYFNAAGADPDGESGESHDPETHLLPLVIQSVYDPQFTLKIFGNNYDTVDGTCVRDYTHVTDLATAHVKALEWSMQNKVKYEAFNLGSGRGASVLQIIRAVEDYTKKSAKYVFENRRPGDPDELIADITKAHNILQWSPVYDLSTIVRTACEWHKKQH